MKRIIPKNTIFFAIFSTLAHASHFQPSVNHIINSVDPSINMSMKVVDLDTGEVLFQRDANKSLIPASNMKLYSNAAALLTLGPDYQFRTTLSTSASLIENGSLKGTLYLSLPGDPSLRSSDLNQLFSQLEPLGVKQINGNIVIDSTHQSIDSYAPGIVPKDITFAYGAPLGPIMLDENRLTATVNPAWQAGLPAQINLSARFGGIELDNQVKTVASSKGCGIGFHMTGNHLLVKGCIGRNQSAIQHRMAIRDPLNYTRGVIQQQLKQHGIAFSGQILLGKTQPNSFFLASHLSEPTSRMIADTMKPSDNLYADSLYLHTAHKLKGSPVNWSEAQPIIKHFLETQTGINLSQSKLIDGSGLSRFDLLSAEQTVNLLKYLHDRFPLAYEYISALPISGQDGTLQKRLRGINQQGLVRAKTGSMTGVVSLSGYLYTANGHTLAFAIFINTRPGTKPNVSGRYRSLVDTLCAYFLRQSPDSNHIVKGAHPQARVAFQQIPSQADRARQSMYKWRNMEYRLKQALQNQAATVVFQDNQLIIQDHGANTQTIWQLLQTLNQKYSFSVAVQSAAPFNHSSNQPLVIWIKNNNSAESYRTWTIREAIG